MRDYLIVQLKDLIKHDQVDRKHAQELLELFDEESEDTSEQNAYDEAQQNIQILLRGQWDQ